MHVLTCFPKITYGDCIQKTTWQSGLWEFCWNEEGIEEGMGLFLECWGNRSVERRLRERERVWRYCWVIGARNHVCWEIAERLLRDCWGSGNVERMLENCCWDSWGNGSVREVWETVVRLLTELKHLSTAFNIPNSTQATSPQKIFSNSHRITQKHLSDISQTFLNITQTSLKHLSTTFINILQTISDNITLIITNQNHMSPQENLWIIYGSSMDNLRIIYG